MGGAYLAGMRDYLTYLNSLESNGKGKSRRFQKASLLFRKGLRHSPTGPFDLVSVAVDVVRILAHLFSLQVAPLEVFHPLHMLHSARLLAVWCSPW